jgi:ubiquinone/menaquinone biosynthesis C-methylase UbiE
VTDPSAALAAEYSAKADAYVEHWLPVIGPMALPLLDRLPLATARHVLDVGTGTGALLPHLAARAPAARIIGIDPALGMLHVAWRHGHRGLIGMDAQWLALRSDAFDVATLAFMLFHVPDPLAALHEVRRVMRSGGVAGIVTWGRDEGMPGLKIWKEELDRIGAAPDPRDPIVMQQQRMDTGDKLSRLLLQAGFSIDRTWSQLFESHWTIEEIVATQRGCGLTARRSGSLPARDVAECEARARRRLAELGPDALIYRPEILFAIAISA